jgi:hypothetical protein
VRKGIKTTEFWLGIGVAIVGVIQRWVWPDDPIPKESFIPIITWIAARFGEKALSEFVTKRPWKTTEFWVALGFAVARYIFPNIPETYLWMAQTYIVGRPIMKATEGFGLVGPRNRTTGPQITGG